MIQDWCDKREKPISDHVLFHICTAFFAVATLSRKYSESCLLRLEQCMQVYASGFCARCIWMWTKPFASVLAAKINNITRWAIELNHLMPCFRLSALYSSTYCNRWPSMAPLSYGIQYGCGKLGLIWQKKRRPPPFSHLAVLIIYG